MHGAVMLVAWTSSSRACAKAALGLAMAWSLPPSRVRFCLEYEFSSRLACSHWNVAPGKSIDYARDQGQSIDKTAHATRRNKTASTSSVVA